MVIPTLRWKFAEVPGLYDQLQEIIEALKNINKDNFRNYPDLSGVSIQNLGDLSTNSVSIGGYSIGSSEASYIDGQDQALKTSDSPTFADLHLTAPSTIYSDLNHDSFAGFVANEHIDWTGTTEDFYTTGDVVISGASKLVSAQIGDDTNYINITDDGVVTLNGNARVLKEVTFALDGIGKGSSAPTLVRDTHLMGYQFGIGDDGYLSFEIPVDWDSTAGISISIHVYVNEDYDITSGEMRFQGLYSCIPEDGSEAIDAATHTGTLDSGDINISTTAKGMIEIMLGTIPAADLAQHDTVSMLLSRIAVNDGVEVTAEPVVIMAEYQYTSNKLGEAI